MVYSSDAGTVTWCPETEERPDGVEVDYPLVDGPDGFLFGPPRLTAIVDTMRRTAAETVVLGHGFRYRFTASRSTLADLAAAMVLSGGGRGMGNDALWAVLSGNGEAEGTDPIDHDDAVETAAASTRVY